MALITPAQLRVDFSEFKNPARYPTGQLQFWLNFAYAMLNAGRWGSQLNIAAELYAAHNVALERRALDEAALNAVPGGTTGPINSKSVDKVSVAYSVSDAVEEGGGQWNLTIYGTRLLRLIRIFGMGPVYIGGGNCGLWNSGAWAGPPYWPGWYGGT